MRHWSLCGQFQFSRGASLKRLFLLFILASGTFLSLNLYAQTPLLWVKADQGGTSWTDQSGNAVTVTQAGTVTAGIDLNFNPTNQFSGAGHYDTLFAPNAIIHPDLSVIAVYVPSQNTSGAVWGEDDGGFDRFILDGNTTTLNNSVSSGTAALTNITNLFVTNQPTLTSVIFDEDAGTGSSVVVQGQTVLAFTSNHAPESADFLEIGALGQSNFLFNGRIAEVLVYSGLLTGGATTRQEVESYLAVKYGITLNQTTATSYIGSAGQEIYDADGLFNSYDNNIIGIAQDLVYELDQRVSASVNAGSVLTLATTQDFVNDNQNGSRVSLGDGNFLLTGHDGGSTGFTETFNGNANQRMQRVWRIDETGTVGNVFVAIPSSLLTDPNQRIRVVLSNTATFDTASVTTLTDDGTHLSAQIDPADAQFMSFIVEDPDFGDAPGGYDATARHFITPGINLGSDPDADTGVFGNGVDANGNATDDDTPGDPAGGVDDEDGISIFPILSEVSTTYSLSLAVNNGDSTNTASVYAWIDFDQDNVFEESERATLSAGTVSPTGLTIPASSSGTVNLDWSGLSGLSAGVTYARVRITTDTSLVAGSNGGEDEASVGAAADGEVEDYAITILPAAELSLTKLANDDTDVTAGQTITYTYTLTNSGVTTVTNVSITDNHTSASGTVQLTVAGEAISQNNSGLLDLGTANDGIIDTLGAGDVVTLTSTYTVTAGDIAADADIINVATASGTPVGGGSLSSDPATEMVDVAGTVPPPAATDIDDDNDGLLDAEESNAGSTNLALTANGGVASMSTTLLPFAASICNDGNTAGSDVNTTICHSTEIGGLFSWIQIDLGAVFQLTTVNIFNRDNCCQDRLSNAHVLVSNEDFSSGAGVNQDAASLSAAQTQASFQTQLGAISGDAFLNLVAIAGERVQGRYVRIQLNGSASVGDNVINLAEIQVIGGNVDRDTDGDGIVDRLDLDSDNDGISDLEESGADRATLDPDNNGIIDGVHGTNGLSDAIEATNGTDTGTTPAESTADADTTPNYLDLDSDGDGIPDAIEAQSTASYTADYANDGDVSNDDSDGDGVIDVYDGAASGGIFNTPQNSDSNGEPDYLDTDSDGDGDSDNLEGGSAITGVSFTDPDGSAHNGTVFALLDTDADVSADGSNAIVLARDFDYRENLTIGAAKAIMQIVDNGNGTFSATYNLLIENTTTVELFDLQATDLLSAEFGAVQGSIGAVDTVGEYFVSIGSIDTTGVSNGGNTGFSTSGSYTGTAPNTGVLDPSSSGSLQPDDQVIVPITVTFFPVPGDTTYTNQFTAAGDISENGAADNEVTDLSTNGADPDQNGDIAGNNGDNDPTNTSSLTSIEVSMLDLTKLADDDTDVTAGQVVTYTYTVTNSGASNITNLSITDNHSSASGTVQLTVAGEAISQNNSGILDLGTANDGVIATLGPNDVVTLTSTYTVTAGDITADADIINVAVASGTLTGGATITSAPATEMVDVAGTAPPPAADDIDDDNDGIVDTLECAVVHRINSGGGAFTDARGRAWVAGTTFLTGGNGQGAAPDTGYANVNSGAGIEGTSDEILYREVQAGNSTFSYNIPVSDGDYWVVTHWAEGFANGATRFANLSIEGVAVETGFNILTEFGDNVAGTRLYDVTVTGNNIDFDVGGSGFPIISGIEVFERRDTDGDGVLDCNDLDSDNDGISDLEESGADVATLDPDMNGVIDGVHGSNGLSDAIEATNGTDTGTTPAESTADADTTPNYLDLDSDGDGIPDAIEAQSTASYTADYANDGDVSNDDSDGDGVIDVYDGAASGGIFNTPQNSDSNGEPDYLDTDSDGDGDSDNLEGGSAITGVSFTDPDGSAHNGTVFALLDTDADVSADGSNAIVLARDFDYRENLTIGAAKAIMQIVDNGNGTFSATYNLLIENTTTVELFDLQATDLLSAEFGAVQGSIGAVDTVGEYFVSIGSIDTTGVSNGGNTGFSASGSYTGTAPNTGVLDPSSSGSLQPDDQVIVPITVTFFPVPGDTTYTNQFTAAGDISENGAADNEVTDLSTNGADPDQNGDIAGNNGDNDPTNTSSLTSIEVSMLDLTKLADDDTDVTAGQVVTYTYTVTNSGASNITNLSITDNHSSASGTVQLTVAGEAISQNNSGILDLGTANDGVIATLGPNDVVTLTSTYSVTAGDITADADIINVAVASGTLTGGATITSAPATEMVDVAGTAPPPAADDIDDDNDGIVDTLECAVVHRINSGSTAFTDARGRSWLAGSTFVSGGQGATSSAAITGANSGAGIGGTSDQIVYQSVRIADVGGTFNYDIPVSNGDYWVVIHWSELFVGGESRFINLTIEGLLFENNFNIQNTFGPNTANTRIYDVTVTGGNLDIDIDGTGRPKLSGIEVFERRDTDGDGVLDCDDLDSDNDGISDLEESGADVATLDPDMNGVIDGVHGSNGLSDAIEATNGTDTGTTPAESTADADTTPNYLDLDSDGDGIPDAIEAQSTASYTADYANDGDVSNDDSDGDGIIDVYDGVASGGVFNAPQNTDGTGEPDYLDTDADGDATLDADEGGSAITGVSFTDPDGSAHDGSAFSLTNTDNDLNATGSNAIPGARDLDYRQNLDLDPVKSVSVVTNNNDGTFSITYTLGATINTGLANLEDIQVTDELATAFGTLVPTLGDVDTAGEYFVSVGSLDTSGVINGGNTGFVLNSGYTGTVPNTALLDPSSSGSLAPGDTVTVPVTVTFFPAAGVVSYDNQAVVSGDLNANGVSDGEVTDTSPVVNFSLGFDFGDAPLTYDAGVAASHRISVDLRLGSLATDADTGPQSSANADGDDLQLTDDEDSFIGDAPGFQEADTTYSITVPVFNNTGANATLCGFIDAGNGTDGFDGNFDIGTERLCTTVGSNASAQTIALDFSGLEFDIGMTQTYLRLRLASVQTEAEATAGPAVSGEVEDYRVPVIVPGLSITKVADDDTLVVEGQVVTYTHTVTNTGNSAFINVTVDDQHTGAAGTLPLTVSNESIVTNTSGLLDLGTLNDGIVDVLGVGDVVTFETTYTVLNADLVAGNNLTNAAMAMGMTGGSMLTSAAANELVTVAALPPPPSATDDLDDDDDGILDTSESDTTNINEALAANGGVATQSSTLGARPASNCIDGNTAGTGGAGLCHTAATGVNAWWQVDLGSSMSLNQIQVFNRDDGNQNRLSNVFILISNQDFSAETNGTGEDAASLSAAQSIAIFQDQFGAVTGDVVFNLPTGTTGRFIRLQKSGANTGGNDINLAEVQVFGGNTDRDTDGDGVFDRLDLDSDNDGISDLEESGANGATLDPDNNGIIDGIAFGDIDQDGLADAIEATNGADTGTTPADSTDDIDTDANYIDLDSDGDGIPDAIEAQTTASYSASFSNDGNVSNDDSDGDGIIDAYDGVAGSGGAFNTPANTDGLDNPDYLDTDADNDGNPDNSEGGSGVSGVDFDDPDGNAHTNNPGTNVFLLPDSDNDTNNSGSNAIPPFQDLDYRDSPTDFGDAPASYEEGQVTRHSIQANLQIGAVGGDSDAAAQSSAAADGDDNDGTDDEDAFTGSDAPTFDAAATTYSITVPVLNNTGADATLCAFIDAGAGTDGFDGVFSPTTERVCVTVTTNASSQNIAVDFTGLEFDFGMTETFLRLRLATLQSEAEVPNGDAGSGEIEDFRVPRLNFDFGDAPAPIDATARHIIGAEVVRLGSVNPDADDAHFGNGTDDNGDATDDDTVGDPASGVDDEDGLGTAQVLTTATSSLSYTINVNNSHSANAANVYAWLDFDNSGTFDEDERATLAAGAIVPNSAGSSSDLSIPNDGITGSLILNWDNIGTTGPDLVNSPTDIYLRIRITSDDLDLVADGIGSDDAAVGLASDGEVEDYQISVLEAIDFGDAPVVNAGDYDDTNGDGSVTSADNAASHLFAGGVLLGSAWDADSLTFGDGTDANMNATDDDTEGTTPDDEDGVATIPPLPFEQSAPYTVSVSVDNTGGALNANVFGWIDFDQSGSFDADELATGSRLAGTSGNVDLTWTSFPGIALGTTYLRVRAFTGTTVGGSGSNEDPSSLGQFSDGEVEDYQLNVSGTDFGDAPDSLGYFTSTAQAGANAAVHGIIPGLYLGDTLADSEIDAITASGNATDDDQTLIADEGIAQLLTVGSEFPTLLPTTNSYSITVDVHNQTGSTANLFAWIDFDLDGQFDDDERVSTDIANGATTATITWSNIGTVLGPNISTGISYARFRITTDMLNINLEDESADDAAQGPATDGEIEDYQIFIGDFDFGDAPDTGVGQSAGNYRTLVADDGPNHARDPNIFLGNVAADLDPDAFSDGVDNQLNATDDDVEGDADEGPAQLFVSGVVPQLETGDSTLSFDVMLNNSSSPLVPVRVFAWIDFDQSGTFDEDEAAVTGLLGNLASTTLTFSSIPNDIVGGTTYLRLRITSDPLSANGSGEDERSYGSASNGEVEDYQITITGTDFGDAPSAFGTFDVSGGPKHSIVAGLHLGKVAPDGEGDAFGDGTDNNGNATDDDTEGTADEGVAQLLNSSASSFPTFDITSTSYSLTLDAHKTIAGTATVYGWIDWDNDNEFDEDERTETSFSSTSGDTTVTLTWNIGGAGEPDAVIGNTFARFRITTFPQAPGGNSSSADSLALGDLGSANGEVEDYAFVVGGSINIAGTVFEDINFGGGIARNLSSAQADGGTPVGSVVAGADPAEATVELWNSPDGVTCVGGTLQATTTTVDGAYIFLDAPSPANYCVRIVTSSIVSARATNGSGNTPLAVQTFRSQSTTGNGAITQIFTEVGGQSPQSNDSAAAVFDANTRSWSPVSAGSTDIANLDFGYNFNTVVNTNASGQGSLRQFMLNAGELVNTGLAQNGQTAGIDVSIFAIPSSDSGFNTTGQNEFTISLPTDLPTVTGESVALDGSTQTGVSCPRPLIELAGAGATNGFNIEAGDSLVRGFIINGFSGSGVLLAAVANGNRVQCNYIGANVAGSAAGNGGNGTGVTVNSSSNFIGFATPLGGQSSPPGQANLISGNIGVGVQINANNNVVQQNLIGTAADGLSALGNGAEGVVIDAADNQIGSPSESTSNTIAFNGAAGIGIEQDAANTGNGIFINSIHSNGDTGGAGSARTLGIDLGRDGVTANDGATDADTGANTLINFPVLGSIVMGGSANTMDVPFTLALPDGTYRVDFYANSECNPLNTGAADVAAPHGEAQDFLGLQSVIVSGGVANVTTATLSTLGIIGNQVSARVQDTSSFDGSEMSVCAEIPAGVVTSAAISGTIFEDANYGGGVGRNLAAAGAGTGVSATVELWAHDGNTCSGAAPLQATTAGTDGSYNFNTVNDTGFCVRVVNSTVRSNRAGWIASLIPVQTFRSESTDGASTVVAVTDEVGGRSPQDVDSAPGTFDLNPGDGTATLSWSLVDVSGGSVTGLDFGYNFSTIVNVNESAQGSFRQFTVNANTLDNSGLAQSGLTAGHDTSIFMVANGAALPGLTASFPNLLNSNSVAQIALTSDVSLTAANILIDGATQTNNVGGNSASLGTGGTVGTQSLALNSLSNGAPEVQLDGGGLVVSASDVEIRNVALSPTATAISISAGLSGHIIEDSVIGGAAHSFPAVGVTEPTGSLIVISGATGNGTAGTPGSSGLIQNNLIGFGGVDGVALDNGATGWSILANEFNSFDGGASTAAISLGTNVGNTNIRGNLIQDGTLGIRLENDGGSNAADEIDENSILNNTDSGILITASATGDGLNTISENVITGNGGAGVAIAASQQNTITVNVINNNNGLGIDLGDDGLVDAAENAAGPNIFLSSPVITSVTASDGVNLNINGNFNSTLAVAPVQIELYANSVCNPNTVGSAEVLARGEGELLAAGPSASVFGTFFNIATPLALVGTRSFFTVIARDANGNTSEFSNCEQSVTSDYGDAPNSFGTLKASNGASHIRNTNLRLGTALTDIESDGVPTTNALGDDIDANGDDEDSVDPVTDFTSLISFSTSFQLNVDTFNQTGTAANLVGWIDFDQNGTFDNDEVATVSVPSGGSAVSTLNWTTLPVDRMSGDTYVRLRLTTDTSIATGVGSTSLPAGAALDGEVEDFAINIPVGFDYGDAPDNGSGYNTADGNNPARHGIDDNRVWLGFVPPDGDGLDFGGDGINDGFNDLCNAGQTTGGSDDDCEGIDDEEGSDPLGLITGATSYVAQAVVTNNTGGSVFAYAWLDFNRNGQFEVGEGRQSTGGAITGSGTSLVTFNWASFPGITSGLTYMRIRVSSTDLGTSGFSGDAVDGEVEDYQLLVASLSCNTIYGVYNFGGGDFDDLATWNPNTNAIGFISTFTQDIGSAAIGLSRQDRRLYYLEWIVQRDGAPNDELHFFDGANHINTNSSIALGGDTNNWNRMAFDYDGLGWAVESGEIDGNFNIFSFNRNIPAGLTSFGTIANVTLGDSGDIAFDRDNNMYMVTYNTAVSQFYLYRINNHDVPNAASATLLLTGTGTGGGQVAGIAFFDGFLYLQASNGRSFRWDVGLNTITQLAAIGTGSADLGSCIFPILRPVIAADKSVTNITDPTSLGFSPGDILEYNILVRNTGGLAANSVTFIDAIPANSSYVPNSTFIQRNTSSGGTPVQVADIGGQFPYLTATELHSDSQVDGTLLAVPNLGSTENTVVITFRVQVDGGTNFDSVCNVNGIIDFDDSSNGANATPVAPVGTNNPSTAAIPATTNGGTETTDPTCLEKVSGYAISGTVFEDVDVDEILDVGEDGIPNAEVVLQNVGLNTCQTTSTDGNGNYSFEPLEAGFYVVYESDGASSPAPGICPPAENDPSGFQSSTANSFAVQITNDNVPNQNFGDLRPPSFSPNNSGTVLPNNSIFYAHTFSPETLGTLTLSVNEITSPTNNSWTTTLFRDQACDGDFDIGDNVISGSISASGSPPTDICILAQVSAPTNANAGDQHVATITAVFDYPGTGISNTVLMVTDSTTALSAGDGTMVLSKLVENITVTSEFFDNGIGRTSNDAAPGDQLRYTISFQNISTGPITTIDLFDTVPVFTELATDLLFDCFTDPANSFGNTSVTGCTIANPTGNTGAGVGHPTGFNGSIQWDLTGSLQPGESGSVSFIVEVE